ncbi:hypothetical protein GCM10027217_46230 [Pseudomaricurvus hydrocarbonicus]
MTIGNAIGEFSSKSTSITVSDDNDGRVITQVNFEGMADGYGVITSTMAFYGSEPGADRGHVSYAGQAFPPEGRFVTGTGEGVFEESGTHEWRVRLTIHVSDGKLLLSDGIVKLKDRSYTGKIYEWE